MSGNPEHIELIKQGSDVWNEWRRENPDTTPNLQFADLAGLDLGAHTSRSFPINLREADLRGANLTGADLEYAYLQNCNLAGAVLKGANLHVARLTGANMKNVDLSHAYLNSEYDDLAGMTELERADLTNANLSFASLRDVWISGANLTRALLFKTTVRHCSFHGVIFDETVIISCDLSGATGFEKSKYLQSSYIDIGSVEQAGGLPINFLRGFGVNEEQLKRDSPLIGKESSIYHTTFISYSSEDSIFAHRLRADLRDRGVSCWFAPEDLEIGAKIRSTLDLEIQKHEKVLLILSESSIQSQWVEQEVAKALEKERELGKENQRELVLFPIRLDNKVLEEKAGWANFLKNTRNIGDFTKWQKPQLYDKSLSKLLQGLEKKE